MDEDKETITPVRQFARKNEQGPGTKKNVLADLESSSGFVLIMGFLFLATGLIVFIPFHNKFGKLMLVLGFLTIFYGFLVKLINICVRIITGEQ